MILKAYEAGIANGCHVVIEFREEEGISAGVRQVLKFLRVDKLAIVRRAVIDDGLHGRDLHALRRLTDLQLQVEGDGVAGVDDNAGFLNGLEANPSNRDRILAGFHCIKDVFAGSV